MSRRRADDRGDKDAEAARIPELLALNEKQQLELNQILECLGGWDEETCPEEPIFVPNPKAIEHIRDLQRCLRREDPQLRSITLQLGRWRFVSRYLLPLLISSSTAEDNDLAAAIVKLLVTLTMPLPENVEERVRAEHLSWLQDAKESFAHKHVIVAIMAFIAKLLLHRDEDATSNNLIELVLTLFRNFLLIADVEASPSSGADYRAHLHDRLVMLFHSENVFDLLVLVGQSIDGPSRHWDLLLLEIVYLILRWETPQSIWDQYMRAKNSAELTDSGDRVKESEPNNDGEEDSQTEEEQRIAMARRMSQLATAARLQEEYKRELQRKRMMRAISSPRHSRFGGTYSRVTQDGRQRVMTKSVHEITNTVLGRLIEKNKKGTVRSHGIQFKKIKKNVTKHSSLEGLIALKHFASTFLEKGCYNNLLEAVGEDIRQCVDRLQAYDEVHYVWMISFFTGFQRLCNKNRDARPVELAKVNPTTTDEEDKDSDEMALERQPQPAAPNVDEYDIATIGNEDAMEVALEAAEKKKPEVERESKRPTPADRTKAQRLELIGPIAAGIEFEVFEYAGRKLHDFVEGKLWEKAEVALRAVKEIVLWVGWMREEPLTVTAGNSLLSNIIYNQEHFLSVLIQLAKVYNPSKAPLSLLRNTIETLVMLLSMTEDYAKRYKGRVYVRAPAHKAASTRGGSDEEEDDEDGASKKSSRADDGNDDVLNLVRLISNIANNNIITNCCLLLKFHRLNPVEVNQSVVTLFKRLIVDYGDEYKALFYRLAVVKQLHDVLAEPELLYAQALRSGSLTAYAAGGLEGLADIAKLIVSGIAKLAATDPYHYVHLLFQKSRSDVTFQSLALAQTEHDSDNESGPKRQTKAKKKAKKAGEKQWTKAEDQVLKELMDLFGDLPVDKLFQFISNDLPNVPEIEIGRRLVSLGLMSEETFSSRFPGSASRSVGEANSLADVFGGDSDDDTESAPTKGVSSSKPNVEKPKLRTQTPKKVASRPASRVAPRQQSAPKPRKEKQIESDSDEDGEDAVNDENDRNSGNVASPQWAEKSKRTIPSLCEIEDIEAEVLMQKLHNLADDPEGLHALQWLIDQLKKCQRERKKAEKNDDVVGGFVLRASDRGEQNEFIYLALKWLGRTMTELGLRGKETDEGITQWKVPSSMRARSISNRISILEMAHKELSAERQHKAAAPSRRDLLTAIKRKRRSWHKGDDEDRTDDDHHDDGRDDREAEERTAAASPLKKRKIIRKSKKTSLPGDALLSDLDEDDKENDRTANRERSTSEGAKPKRIAKRRKSQQEQGKGEGASSLGAASSALLDIEDDLDLI